MAARSTTTPNASTERAATRPTAAKRATAPLAARPRRSWKEERELEGMEARILEAESARNDLSSRLADPALYQDTAEAARVGAAFREAEALVDALYARWAELEALGE